MALTKITTDNIDFTSNLVFSNVNSINITNSLTVGNSSVNVSINSTSFSGSANNANNIGGVAAANYVQNTDSRTLSGNLNFTGTNTYFTAGLSTGSNTVTIGTATYFVSNGNVGIATSSPAAKFDVNGGFAGSVTAVSASEINCSSGNYFTKTASGALTWTITNVPSSRSFSFILRLTNGGTGTQTWPASVKWPNGTAPTLTTSGVDILGFITEDGGTTWRGVALMVDSK